MFHDLQSALALIGLSTTSTVLLLAGLLLRSGLFMPDAALSGGG
jgi:hypothetical protein